MPGPFPNLLAVMVDKTGKFHLVSSLVGKDEFLGPAHPGDCLVAASHDRPATGFLRRIAESKEKVFAVYGDTVGVGMLDAFEDVVLDLVEQAYLAGREKTIA